MTWFMGVAVRDDYRECRDIEELFQSLLSESFGG
jgi:hypothetical protein